MPESLYVVGIELAQLRDDRLHTIARAFDRDAGLETGDAVQVVVSRGPRDAWPELGIISAHLHQRHPEHRHDDRDGTAEVRRRDANDRVAMAVEQNGAADDLRVATEYRLPSGVTQNRDRVRARLRVFVQGEGPTALGVDVECREEVG